MSNATSKSDEFFQALGPHVEARHSSRRTGDTCRETLMPVIEEVVMVVNAEVVTIYKTKCGTCGSYDWWPEYYVRR